MDERGRFLVMCRGTLLTRLRSDGDIFAAALGVGCDGGVGFEPASNNMSIPTSLSAIVVQSTGTTR